MSEFEQKILDRLTTLETEVERLKSEKLAANKALEFERLPDSATVGKDYVAYRFKCSEERVMRGKSGTGKIPRLSKRPLKFLKKDVDDVWGEYSKTPKEKAAALIQKANERKQNPKRRKSIIKKQMEAA